MIVLKSGGLVFTNGTCDNGVGKAIYFSVWRKQPDGKWKVLVDAAWEVPAGKK